MPSTPADRSSVRPSAEVNAEIRSLVAAGGADTYRYLQLLEEWSAAVQAELETAA